MWLKNTENLFTSSASDSEKGKDYGKDLRIRLLFLAEDPIIDLALLELVDFLLILAEIDGFLAQRGGCPLVVAVEDGPFEQQSQSRRLGDGDLRGSVRVHDALGVAPGSDEHCRHGDHLADLVHHEALAVDFEAEPLGAIDDDRVAVDLEGLDEAFGGGVGVGLLDGVVVEIVGADVLV